MLTVAHLSDLHIGRCAETHARARALCDALSARRVDRVLISGDVTHRGRLSELAAFEELFAPLRQRIDLVPGNHDRVSDDAGAGWMGGARVLAESHGPLYLIRVDSTGPHNRSYFRSDGALCPTVLAQIEGALAAAPSGATVALMLHHHVVHLPEESLPERLSSWIGLPHAKEVPLAPRLLALLRGRCDLILHGHRHVPAALDLPAPAGRPLRVLNAGSSTELAACRILRVRHGSVSEQWLSLADRDCEPGLIPVPAVG